MGFINEETSKFQTLSDGKTVWVNAFDRNCVSRFGRMGVDVHHTLADQERLGEQCLACTHGPTHLADWKDFQALTLKHHGVKVSDRHMPGFIRKEMLEAPQQKPTSPA